MKIPDSLLQVLIQYIAKERGLQENLHFNQQYPDDSEANESAHSLSNTPMNI